VEHLTLNLFSSSVSLRERLPDNIQKVLAERLEASGGIRSFRGHWHKPATLCGKKFEEDRSSPFGRRADPIRRKLQSKVLKWQSKEEKGCTQVKFKSFGSKVIQHTPTRTS
jgi:hypothetical protein